MESFGTLDNVHVAAGDRELYIDMLEKMTGARVTHAYFVPGGIRNDVPANFEDMLLKRVNYFENASKNTVQYFMTIQF